MEILPCYRFIFTYYVQRTVPQVVRDVTASLKYTYLNGKNIRKIYNDGKNVRKHLNLMIIGTFW